MTPRSADCSSLEADCDFDLHEQAVFDAQCLLSAMLAISRDLTGAQARCAYAKFGCATIEEYGTLLGVPPAFTRMLVDLGRALDAPPPSTARPNPVPPETVEEAVRQGSFSVQKASFAGQFLGHPELLRPREYAVEIAAKSSVRRLVQMIRERKEENAQGRPVVPVTLAVTYAAKESFSRARDVASHQAGRLLTEGETFGVVVEHYLDCEDPLRRAEGTRRLPDTAEIPESRTIPAAVEREVRRRAEESCEVPACPNRTYLRLAHVRAHRDRGSREADTLVRLWTRHHRLFDAGVFRFVGWVGGRPRFRDREGRELGEEPMWAPQELHPAPP